MLKFPSRNDSGKSNFEKPELVYFNNYNQDSFVECFQTFPNSSAQHVLSNLINFLGNNLAKDSFRIKGHNLSINDIVFANTTIGSMNYLMGNSSSINVDLNYLVSEQKIRTFNIRFIDDIYFRFYFFEDYSFDKSTVPLSARNIIDRRIARAEQYHFYTLSYSLSSNLGPDKDVRIVDFFFDSKYNDSGNLIELFAKVVDSMIMEYLRRSTNKSIPFNTVTNFAPAYIAFPEFVTVDAINFIYNYLFTTFNIFNSTNLYIEYGDFTGNTNISNLIKIAYNKNILGHGVGVFHEKDSYFEPMWMILMGEIDSHDAIEQLYLAYKKEIGKANKIFGVIPSK